MFLTTTRPKKPKKTSIQDKKKSSDKHRVYRERMKKKLK